MQTTFKHNLAETKRELTRIPDLARQDWRNFKQCVTQKFMATVVHIVEHPILTAVWIAAFIGLVWCGAELGMELTNGKI